MDRLAVLLVVLVLVIGCGGTTDAGEFASTGEAGDETQEATGGDATGGSESDTGGREPTGGTTTGGSATGGALATGGDATGGTAAVPATGGAQETGGSATGGAVTTTGGTLTGGTGMGGTGTGGSATGGTPSTGGESTGGDLPTGGNSALCSWTCLSVTRLSGSPDPISATTTLNGVECSTSPSDACTKDATFAIHSVCAVGDRTPEETTDCLPNEVTGTGGSGGQEPSGWSCRYFAYDSDGTVTDEATLDGDCGDPCDVLLPLMCARTQMTGCEDWSCDRADIECTFDGQAMATDYNGVGLGVECIEE